ncbi:MAG: energy transducer TonB [Bacteroidota bacterium]
MKNSFIALYFFLAVSSANAQVKVTLYYNRGWELTTKDSARYIRTTTYDTLNYYFNGPVEDRFLSGDLQMKGEYVDGLKEGQFTFYYENGHVESTGRFESNARSGVWKYFYRNAKPKAQLEFTPVFGNEPAIKFMNDSTGRQILQDGNGNWFEVVDLPNGGTRTIHGQYKDNEKAGKWTMREMPGKTIIVENFNKGRFLNGYVKVENQSMEIFDPQDYTHLLPEKFLITEEFAARKGVDFNVYPRLKYMFRNGDPVVNYIWDEGDPVFTNPEVFAKPPEGLEQMYRLLDKEMVYPEQGRIMGIQGKVYVEFLADRGGNLRRFKVVRGIGGGCDEEAVRVLQEYADKHQWSPATIQGKRVKQLFLLSLQFQLEL